MLLCFCSPFYAASAIIFLTWLLHQRLMLTRFLCLQLPNFCFSLVSFINFCSLFQVYRYLDFLASILEHPCAKVCYFCGVPISFWHLLLILPPLPLPLSLSLSHTHTHTHTYEHIYVNLISATCFTHWFSLLLGTVIGGRHCWDANTSAGKVFSCYRFRWKTDLR